VGAAAVAAGAVPARAEQVLAALVRHRPWIGRVLPWAAVGLTVAAVLAGFLVEAGAARRFVVFYVAPMMFALPLWARIRLETLETEPPGRLALDGTVVTLAIIRTLTGALPFSGHMLFLVYTLFTTPRRGYRWLALALIAETTAFKLAVWGDVWSWSLGLAGGLACAGVHAWLGRRRAPA
jgi:hypothetical protein